MEKKGFKTKWRAKRDLRIRRKAAYKRIRERGDKVVGDRSFVYASYDGMVVLKIDKTKKLKWYSWLAISTEEMIKDFEKECERNYEQEIIDLLAKEA